MTIENQVKYSALQFEYTVISASWRRGQENPEKEAEFIEVSHRFIQTVSSMPDLSDDAKEGLDKACINLGEALYNKYSGQIMNGERGETSIRGLIKAKEYFEMVLPYKLFGEGIHFQDQLDATNTYINVLRFLFLTTREQSYLEQWHKCSNEAYEMSKGKFVENETGMRYKCSLLEPLIGAKLELRDLDRGEALLSELRASGENADLVDRIARAYQSCRNEITNTKEEKPKRKKLFGLF